VESYQRRPPGAARKDSASDAREIVNDASAFLRRLIPFPGSETLSPLSLLPLPGQAGGMLSNPVAKPIPDIVGQQAASIVSQAASILDEEMAKGVLAARRSSGAAPQGYSDATTPLLRQVHDLVDSVAAMWPSVQNAAGAQPLLAPQPVASDADPLAELRPRTTVKPGQRATISMTLCNSESRVVRLVPAATDLLGSRGGGIAASLLEFTPPDCSLEPQEQRDLAITTTVPSDTAPGCYSGLLVVRGVDYLRALVTIEVV
jgi:hypothetical protein